ncbi:MAG: hypothetical protein RL689_395 [Planctomycetota bacterium]|jgi:hypothetical protein
MAAAWLAAMAGVAFGAVDRAAPVTARQGVMNLRTGDVAFATLPDLLVAERFEVSRAVLRLEGPITPTRREALNAAGVLVLGFLPTDGVIADVRGSTPAKVKATGFVSGVHAYEAAWKIDPAVAAAPAKDSMRVNVWLFELAAPDATRAAMAAMGGVTIEEVEPVGAGVRIAAWCDAATARSFASFDDVQYVEPVPTYELRSNQTTRWTMQSGVLNATPLHNRGLIGTGQVIGVIDGGLAAQHCSFLDPTNPIGPLHRKIVGYNTTQVYDQHGTHVSCTAAGDAGSVGNTRGMAYGARIAFNTYPSATETSVFTKHQTHLSQGAFIHTNSWGTDATRAYDGGSRAIDVLQWENEETLVTHAVSNGTIVTNPENAKNSLCVTANRNGAEADQICVGGTGPTLDGRRKPEVAAPGCLITSATGTSGCSVTTLSGTSMATPATGGLAVLVREYFLDGFYPTGAATPADGFSPSGALVKAAIINAAQDMTSLPGYPSDREGWGRVVADASLFFAGDARRLVVRDVRAAGAASLQTGGSYEFGLLVDSPSQALRVTMSYHDAPAQVNAALTPVNNLNLVVVSPAGETYLGNAFDGGFSAMGGTADALNNTEQVHIAAPVAGVWSVRVEAAAVNQGPQGFAIVATGAVADAPDCLGDFNQDGGVDGQDVEAFFLAWGDGLESADVNQDGGVDGQDVETFFLAWEGGC